MSAFFNFFLSRLREPSTWAAIGTAALAVNGVPPDVASATTGQVVSGLAIMAGALLGERR
jgi:hypothetical protein